MSAQVNNNTYATINTLFYLLYARYGNSSIASSDTMQFKYKLWTIIFEYGINWAKRLDVQQKIRDLSLEETITSGGTTMLNPLYVGTQQINNSALNPATAPVTSSLESLTKIDQQNTINKKRSMTDAWTALLALLETDVSTDFLDKFKGLFLTVVSPQDPLWYVSDYEDENGDSFTSSLYGSYRTPTFVDVFTDPAGVLDNEHYFVAQYESSEIPCVLPKKSEEE